MRIVLLGGGGHASDVLGAIEEINNQKGASEVEFIDVVGIVDDSEVDPKRFVSRGVKHIGNFTDLPDIDAEFFVACVGYPHGRAAVTAKALVAGLVAAPAIIHPNAFLATGVSVGAGSVILAGVCVSPLCNFGNHTYVSHGSLVGHDCEVHDYASIMPGASVSGDSILEDSVMIGAGATVLQGLRIGKGSTIGAGAVVVKDVPENVVAMGTPAKY